ncbi:MAG: hypothetical protein LBL80_02205 [Ruminococcus sp.]|jgi:hypothetical protein|nr:hypothetical protein [Ruminococcus sp.]
MRWIEDDRHVIPDYIKNMSHEERKKKIAEYEEETRQERDRIRTAKKAAV